MAAAADALIDRVEPNCSISTTRSLAAIASGDAAYATFVDVFTTDRGNLNIIGYVVGIGLTWAVFQHMASGIRHLVMDTGAAFELKVNQLAARLTFVFSIAMTILFWLWLGLK